MGQWLESEGEDPSSGLPNGRSEESEARKASGRPEDHCSNSMEKTRESDFAGGIQETIEADKRDSDRRLDKTLHEKVQRVETSLGAPHVEYVAVS